MKRLIVLFLLVDSVVLYSATIDSLISEFCALVSSDKYTGYEKHLIDKKIADFITQLPISSQGMIDRGYKLLAGHFGVTVHSHDFHKKIKNFLNLTTCGCEHICSSLVVLKALEHFFDNRDYQISDVMLIGTIQSSLAYLRKLLLFTSSDLPSNQKKQYIFLIIALLALPTCVCTFYLTQQLVSLLPHDKKVISRNQAVLSSLLTKNFSDQTNKDYHKLKTLVDNQSGKISDLDEMISSLSKYSSDQKNDQQVVTNTVQSLAQKVEQSSIVLAHQGQQIKTLQEQIERTVSHDQHNRLCTRVDMLQQTNHRMIEQYSQQLAELDNRLVDRLKALEDKTSEHLACLNDDFIAHKKSCKKEIKKQEHRCDTLQSKVGLTNKFNMTIGLIRGACDAGGALLGSYSRYRFLQQRDAHYSPDQHIQRAEEQSDDLARRLEQLRNAKN